MLEKAFLYDADNDFFVSIERLYRLYARDETLMEFEVDFFSMKKSRL